MGPSFKYQGRQVEEIIAGALPVSLSIGTLAIVIATVVGISAGTLAGVRRGGPVDALSLGGRAGGGVSVPSFVIASALLGLFAYGWAVVPAGRLAVAGVRRPLGVPAGRRRGGGGVPVPHDPAGRRALAAADGVHHPAHAGEHDRHGRQRLRPHRPRQGRGASPASSSSTACATRCCRSSRSSARPRRRCSWAASWSRRSSTCRGWGRTSSRACSSATSR